MLFIALCKENFDLHPLDDLDEDTRLTIQIRKNLKPIPSICAHHKAAYKARFKQLKQSKKCDNTFDTHLKTKRPLGEHLVNLQLSIKLDATQHKFHVYPGQHLCSNCFEQLEFLALDIDPKKMPNLQSDTTNLSSVIFNYFLLLQI